MDFGLALTYQFKDPEWLQKILIAALVSLIPVFGWILVFGWSLEVTRRVILNDPAPLPHLHFVEDFVSGLKAIVINLIYSLPAMIVIIPIVIFIGLASAASDTGWFRGVNLMIGLCVIGASILYSLVLMFVLPAAYGHLMANNGGLGASLEVKAIFRKVRAAPAAYVLVVVGQILCGFLAGLGIAACIIGVVVTSTYTYSIMGHLYGQAYKEAHIAESSFPHLE